MLPLPPLQYGGNPPLRVLNLPALDVWHCHVTFVESTTTPGWFQHLHITFVVQNHPRRALRYNYGVTGGNWTQHDVGALDLVPNESVFRYHADQMSTLILNACRELLRMMLEMQKKLTSTLPKGGPGNGGLGGGGTGSGTGSKGIGGPSTSAFVVSGRA